MVQVAPDGRATLLRPGRPRRTGDAGRTLAELVGSADGASEGEDLADLPGCDGCVAAVMRDVPSDAPHHRPYPAPDPRDGVQVVELLVGPEGITEPVQAAVAALPPGLRLEVLVTAPPLPDVALLGADLPPHRTWVQVELRRETWPQLGATLRACDGAGLPVEVRLAQEPPRARLDHLPPRVLAEVVTSLRREGSSLLPRLTTTAGTWERTLAQVQHQLDQAVARDTREDRPPDLSLAASLPASPPRDAWTQVEADRTMAVVADRVPPVVRGRFRCDLDDHITWSTPTVLGVSAARCLGRSFYELGVEIDRVLGVGRAGAVHRTVATTHLSWEVRYPSFARGTVVEAITVGERGPDGALVGTYTHAIARRQTS